MENTGKNTEKQNGYVDAEYLNILAQTLEKLKTLSYNYMHIEKGHKVLDVGCGPGSDTIPIAELVGSSGYVAGVDFDEDMVLAAQKSAQAASVEQWVEHYQGDAVALPFKENYFDSCRSERVFQHVENQGLTSFALARTALVLDDCGRIAVEENVLTEDELERLIKSFEDADEKGTFFGYLNLVLVAGQKATTQKYHKQAKS